MGTGDWEYRFRMDSAHRLSPAHEALVGDRFEREQALILYRSEQESRSYGGGPP